MRLNKSNTNLLKKYRQLIRTTDKKILKLVNARFKIAGKIATIKIKNKLPVKNFSVEKDVINFYKSNAKKTNISQQFAETLAIHLIAQSIDIQNKIFNKNQVSTLFNHDKKIARRLPPNPKTLHTSAKTKTIGIIGGFGQMGQWFARYFESQGYHVLLCDVKKRINSRKDDDIRNYKISELSQIADTIIISTPIVEYNDVIKSLIKLKYSGLVIEISSLKSPILKIINSIRNSGLKFASIHPMFGPSATDLANRNIIICETWDQKSSLRAVHYFKDTSANLVYLKLSEHDKMMNLILGLSHLINLIFAQTIVESRISFAKLKEFSSTTFDRQFQVMNSVINENANLYYDIQSQNREKHSLQRNLLKSILKYKSAITKNDKEQFVKLMKNSRLYFNNL